MRHAGAFGVDEVTRPQRERHFAGPLALMGSAVLRQHLVHHLACHTPGLLGWGLFRINAVEVAARRQRLRVDQGIAPRRRLGKTARERIAQRRQFTRRAVGQLLAVVGDGLQACAQRQHGLGKAALAVLLLIFCFL